MSNDTTTVETTATPVASKPARKPRKASTKATKGKRKPVVVAKPVAAMPTVEQQATIVAYGRTAKPVKGAKGFTLAPHKVVHTGLYGIARKAGRPYSPMVLAVLTMLAKAKIVGPTASLTSGELGEKAVAATGATTGNWAKGDWAVRHSVYTAMSNGHAEVYTSPSGKPSYALTPAGVKALAELKG